MSSNRPGTISRFPAAAPAQGPAAPIHFTSSSLAGDYRRVRCLTEDLAAPLGPEDQMVQSMPDASPVKWHRAHTSWFFETFLLNRFVPGYRVFDQRFAYLYNSYYEAVGPRHPRPQRGMITRPGIGEIAAYRAHVDDAMLEFLEGAGAEILAEAGPLVALGLNHEQQHQELILTDIKHAFSLNPLRPAYVERQSEERRSEERQSEKRRSAAPLSWIDHPGGIAAIGHDGQGFAFDNEGPRHQTLLQPFRFASRLVTNGEYLAFMGDGGYARPEFWLSDGWARVQEEGWQAPLYWERAGTGGWSAFTLSGMRAIDPEEPVCHVSLYEAAAHANWAGKRLPREAEWEAVAVSHGGQSAPGNFLEGNLAEGRLHPAPARASSTRAPSQMFGDVWEWTQSAYAPYPGFRPAAGAIGEYNGKFMCNQFVLRGGSCVTPAGHVRATYRNFFPPHCRWQFSGIRLAEDA